MHIQDLYIYPVKSLLGIRVESAELFRSGLQWDRRWVLTDEQGNFLSQRQLKKLAEFSVSIESSGISICHMPSRKKVFVEFEIEKNSPQKVQIWGEICDGYRYGETVSNFFTDILGCFKNSAIHLVQFDTDSIRVITDFEKDQAHTYFADGYPFLLISQESLDDLNARLESKQVPAIAMNRFRPNIVINGVEAYAEDQYSEMKIGDSIVMKICKPCTRCVITTINQENLETSGEPLATLSEYKPNPLGKGVVFGQNCVLVSSENVSINVGDLVSLQ